MLLTEYDEERNAIINPSHFVTKTASFPKLGVSCFSKKLINKMVEVLKPEIIGYLSGSSGDQPIYKVTYKDNDVAIYMSIVGAPSCVVDYEEMTELGMDKLVICGSCGVLDSKIEDTSIIIPTSAIRDEGTSYHYAKETDEVEINTKYIDMINKVLDEHGYSHTKGKTWTTDAPYRETNTKMLRRKEQGCICVEMECSAMATVSQFRDKELIQFFYAADNLDGSNWDKRSLGCETNLSEKEKMIFLALELVINM